ncbi:MAG TPA: c-type cytochrome [Hyphomicrobiales bacterium]|nr:c-type cytochrome [Hyphomicrobiales bacterium]
MQDRVVNGCRGHVGWKGSALAAGLLACLGVAGCGGDPAQAPQFSQVELDQLRERSTAFAGSQAEVLRNDAQALAVGQDLYLAHCTACHGATAGSSARGVPDLTDAVFNYGDSVDAVRTTITQGRHSIMPKHAGLMGEVDIGTLVAYVQALAGGQQMDLFGPSAQRLYQEHCVACHGADGKGNLALGAPDLTDAYWLHGDSMMNIRMMISRGAESQCPAQQDVLSTTEIELLTVYVMRLRDGSPTDG